MSHKKPTPKYYLEYALLRAFTAIFTLLPLGAGLVLAWLAARFAFHVLRFRRAAAERRIVQAVGASGRAARRIAWISLRNFLFNTVELVRLGRMNRAWIERQVEKGDVVDRLRRDLEGQPGAVLAIPHMGNWDLAGVGIASLGFPIFFLTGRQHNPLTDGHVNRIRRATGVEALARGDPHLLRQVLRNLKQRKILGMMPDLRSKRRGIVVRFLGSEANVFGGMAAFAFQARVPVLPAVATRIGWARHRWRLLEPVVPDPTAPRGAELQRLTQRVLEQHEQAIRQQPEQYFWYNTRWVLDPFPGGGKK
ncbi:MAG: lysophospholipid acyltransferase family protein [Planctomycetes bacterium]|nr:lysophospholipid acyltransferase family protein [Planctomycetota bacterium]